MDRHLSASDRLLAALDQGLRTVFAAPPAATPSPGANQEIPHLSDQQRRHVAGLMRVNHSGEVAAQGLYHGQALLERDANLHQWLEQAAREKGDHLAWCRERLADYKVPETVTILSEPLPRNGNGKIHKPTLRTMLPPDIAR